MSPTQQLVEYIKQARIAGMADDKIREGLLQAGWTLVQIDEAFGQEFSSNNFQFSNNSQSPVYKLRFLILILIGLATVAYIGIAYYFANYQNFPLWPFEVPVSSPLLLPKAAESTSPRSTSARDLQLNRLEEAIQARDEIAAYLSQVNPLLKAFDAYMAKSQIALQNRSLSDFTASRKDLELVINRWKVLVFPSVLNNVHQKVLNALNDEMQSNKLAEESIRNRDSAKLIEAIDLTDRVVAAIEESNEELRKIVAEAHEAVKRAQE